MRGERKYSRSAGKSGIQFLQISRSARCAQSQVYASPSLPGEKRSEFADDPNQEGTQISKCLRYTAITSSTPKAPSPASPAPSPAPPPPSSTSPAPAAAPAAAASSLKELHHFLLPSAPIRHLLPPQNHGRFGPGTWCHPKTCEARSGTAWHALAPKPGLSGSRKKPVVFVARNTPWKFNSSPMKMDGWKMSFLLGFLIFRGYVKLQGGKWLSNVKWHKKQH